MSLGQEAQQEALITDAVQQPRRSKMSTEVALFGGKKLPAYLQGMEMDAATKALSGGAGGANRRISIEGGVFRMIVNGEQLAENEDRQMNIVVVAAAPTINRQFYEGTYVKDKSSPATCWSPDGVKPAPDAATPQSKDCASCPQNISGSGQGESRACRYQQRLAVVLEGEIDGPVYQLALPATSLFGKGEPNGIKLPLQAYARHLAQNGVPITAVVTEMKFDTKAATPKLTFKAIRPLTEEEYATSVEQGSSTDAQSAIKLTVFKQDQKPEAPAAKAKAKPVVEEEVEEVEEEEAPAPKPKAKAKPAPAAEVEDDDEPVAVAKAKPAAPAGKRPVSEIISEWDDE